MDRLPPHDMDAEAAVLSAIFLDPAALDRVQDMLGHEQFYSTANAHIYEAIADLRLAGNAADPVLVANWLRDRNRLAEVGGTPYLAQIVDATPAVANVEEHAQVIVVKWRLRQMIAICQAAAAAGYAPVEHPQELLEKVEQQIADVTHQGQRMREEAARTIAGRVLDRIARARARGEAVTGISTGFPALDRLTGGLFESDLIIIAARPGLGKTALAQSLACNVARPRLRHEQAELGHAVLFLTLEQPREQLVMRIASHEAEFDAGLWRRPRVTEEAWQKISSSFDKLRNLPVYVDDTVALTLGELRAKVRRLKRQVERSNADGTALIPSKPLKVVIVDYLQLMKGQREKGDTREREVSSLSQGLKNLAKQEHLVVIALSQLNRELEKQKDRRPQLKDLRESGSIEQDADNVYFLYRESYYDRNTTERLSAELDVAKQRNGPNGLVDLIFRQEYTRYYSAAGEVGDEFDDYFDDG